MTEQGSFFVCLWRKSVMRSNSALRHHESVCEWHCQTFPILPCLLATMFVSEITKKEYDRAFKKIICFIKRSAIKFIALQVFYFCSPCPYFFSLVRIGIHKEAKAFSVDSLFTGQHDSEIAIDCYRPEVSHSTVFVNRQKSKSLAAWRKTGREREGEHLYRCRPIK